MYDISGTKTKEDLDIIIDHWKHSVDTNIISSHSYLTDDNLPVLGIWVTCLIRAYYSKTYTVRLKKHDQGFGTENDKIMDPSLTIEFLDFFKQDGKYKARLFGGVKRDWRSSSSGSNWAQVYEKYDIISPWTVGSYKYEVEIENYRKILKEDVELCHSRRQKFFPVIFPGFSWGNLQYTNGNYNNIFNSFPRRGGAFLWEQVFNFLSEDIDGVYGAMFDEVDEGTGKGRKFLS